MGGVARGSLSQLSLSERALRKYRGSGDGDGDGDGDDEGGLFLLRGRMVPGTDGRGTGVEGFLFLLARVFRDQRLWGRGDGGGRGLLFFFLLDLFTARRVEHYQAVILNTIELKL